MAEKGGPKWNAEANEKILIILLQDYKGKVPYDKIAGELGATISAVQSHLARLKKKNKMVADVADADEDVPNAPRKRKRAPKSDEAGTAKEKKAKAAKATANVTDEGIDDEDEQY